YEWANAMGDPYASQRERVRLGLQTGLAGAALGYSVYLVACSATPVGPIVIVITGALIITQTGIDAYFKHLGEKEKRVERASLYAMSEMRF
ncbi:MAG: hypothetical protein ACE14Q_04630, partial [Acidobacteriota bacterium]